MINLRWKLPSPYWIKVNTDGAALGNAVLDGGSSVFINSRGSTEGCFIVSLRLFQIMRLDC